MKHLRWYDKNPDLKEVFEFIQRLEKTFQQKIAEDLLQLLISDYKINTDEKINYIAKNCKYSYERWYDKNFDLSTSFEIIKDFPEIMQREIIAKIIKTVINIYLEEDKNV